MKCKGNINNTESRNQEGTTNGDNETTSRNEGNTH